MPLTERDLELRRWAQVLMDEIEAQAFTCEAGPLLKYLPWRQLRELVEHGVVDQD